MFLNDRPSNSMSPDPSVRRELTFDSYSDASGYFFVYGVAVRVEDSAQHLLTDHLEDVEGL